jgi:hypothetical protein
MTNPDPEPGGPNTDLQRWTIRRPYIKVWMKPVFRIRDIMRQIRILRSVPTEDYGSGSRYGNCSFRQCFQDANKDMFYFPSSFLLITFCRFIFISLQKDNKSLGSHKTVEIKIFLNFLLYDGRIRIRNFAVVAIKIDKT